MMVGIKGSKWQRREAKQEQKEVRIGLQSGPRPELEGVEY